MMENIDIHFLLEKEVLWNESCCQIEILTNISEKIGDFNSFVLSSLMLASVSDLLANLQKQRDLEKKILNSLLKLPDHSIFKSLRSAQWEDNEFSIDGNIINAGHPSIFCAFPTEVESFDGESGYLILSEKNFSKLIWRDYESKKIISCNVDFLEYMGKWKNIENYC